MAPVIVVDSAVPTKSAVPSALRSVTLSIPRGQLVGVCGGVGAGKSSLLAAMLGLLDVTGGALGTLPSVAYVAQQAWILSDTLRNNILFGEV